ncbi:hypothetical protein SKAU_G00209220 [Synaphobranchus kaupii]|uniref:Uncharacterized protein n=1 Tax=Synaphobranchus kaupii TaxID=118154 RepID=A0A9Q1ISQ7_SYNKA|nr:hypothetical protein SKAU_G00209220 [Synaphobranchus kaupii]
MSTREVIFHCHLDHHHHHHAFKTILQCLEEVKVQVSDLHRKVDLVLLQNIPTSREDLNNEVELLIKTLEELSILEQKLQDET